MEGGREMNYELAKEAQAHNPIGVNEVLERLEVECHDKVLKASSKGFRKIFEGNRCRFADSCKGYQEESARCNKYDTRFSTIEGKIFCGTYRSMQEDEEKEERK